jgi:hypothetical protein
MCGRLGKGGMELKRGVDIHGLWNRSIEGVRHGLDLIVVIFCCIRFEPLPFEVLGV